MEEEIIYPEPQPAGFYKRENDQLLYGVMITGPDFLLIADEHETYNYPVSGWSWFDDEIQARAALGLPPLPTPPEEE